MTKKTAVAATPEPEHSEKSKIDPTRLRRPKAQEEDLPPPRPQPVSAGPVEKAMELAFNPSYEMLPSVTVIDKFQGRLFPLVDLVVTMWNDVFEVAQYRQNKDNYKKLHGKLAPSSPHWLGELLHDTAKWQKSIGGMNLAKITDIALAEMESRAGDGDEGIGRVDAWGRDEE